MTKKTWQRSPLKLVPTSAAALLMLAACGGSSTGPSAQQVPQTTAAGGAAEANTATGTLPQAGAPATSTDAETPDTTEVGGDAEQAPTTSGGNTAGGTTQTSTGTGAPSRTKAQTAGEESATKAGRTSTGKKQEPKADGTKPTGTVKTPETKEVPSNSSRAIIPLDTPAQAAANKKIYDEKAGVTDVGVSKDTIKLGSVNMHGMALGNVLTAPQVRGNLASATAVNDRGGVLGRRLTITDCDDGPGEVSRAKACIKKLAGQDKVFALVTGLDWATASIHDDLKQYKLPYMGAWAYSQTEWQDPYMFPTHMSMVNEAFSGAQWTKQVINPKTYGLVCLTSPEMQIACDNVAKILDGAGSKMVKRVDVGISETSMSAQILAMRSANPDHIVHYVINPATMAKFMVEAAQQGYYPPQGISGNHLGAEV